MTIKHSITLSTTEPNNEIGVIKIRQADEQTQTLEVQITENGVPKPYTGLAVYFCAKLGQTAGLGIIEQKLKPEEMTNPANGKLEYTMRAEDWQILGRQKGYFSFRKMKNEHEFIEQFTTRDFTFEVIKSVYSDGLKEVKKDGSTYVWTIEELIRLFNEYMASGKSDWEEFVEQNREVLESVDPGGKLIGELIDARRPFGSEAYATLGERLDSDKAEVTAQLAHIVTDVTTFGASKDLSDNHDKIIEALDYLKANNGGTLLIPVMLKTSPLILNNEYKNIEIKGVTPNTQPWTQKCGFQIVGDGSVGVQLADNTNEVPSWYCTEMTLTNLYINCDKKVDYGVNGNFGITLDHVTIDNARLDGIVMEGQTYPFILNRVFSRFNGRHGLHVKAPFTTVYNLYDCEFTRNDGYGMFIEDGAGASFVNVLVQSNKQGGVKIKFNNPTKYTKNVFLDNLLFIGLYLENNGLLPVNDPKYEGNYSLRTESYNHTKFTNTGKIGNLTFVNIYGGIPVTGQAGLIQGVSKLSTVGLVEFFINDSTIDYGACGGMRGTSGDNIEFIFQYEAQKFSQTAKRYREDILYNDEKKQILKVGHGYLGMRGRMREIEFISPSVGTKELPLKGETDIVASPIIQEGSIIGIHADDSSITGGYIQFELRYTTTNRKELSNYILLLDETLTPENKTVNIKFPLLKYKIPENAIGVGVKAYYVGYTGDNELRVNLFIES